MEIILNAKQIETALADMADYVIANYTSLSEIAVIGVRSRGEILAQRLSKILSRKLKRDIPCGTLDITLYRDDWNAFHADSQPQVGTTEIGFDIDDKIIVLVDDVLYTGRSTRAALDALIDLGRPKAIKLIVLVERTGREFPIQADFAACKLDLDQKKSVCVRLVESDGKDEVFIE